MHFILERLGPPGCLILLGLSLAGCGFTAKPRPVAYINPPPPGERRCVEYREDMYGRHYCSKSYGS